MQFSSKFFLCFHLPTSEITIKRMKKKRTHFSPSNFSDTSANNTHFLFFDLLSIEMGNFSYLFNFFSFFHITRVPRLYRKMTAFKNRAMSCEFVFTFLALSFSFARFAFTNWLAFNSCCFWDDEPRTVEETVEIATRCNTCGHRTRGTLS